MNKKFLSLAVAAAMAAPMAAQAQDVTIYGLAHVAISSYDVEAGDNAGNDYWDIASHQSRLGIKGSEDLGNGLKAIFKIEWQVSMADDGANSAQVGATGEGAFRNMRNSYVGLAGDWGTVLLGRHDTPYKMSRIKLDLFGGQLGDYNNNGTGGAAPGGEVAFADVRSDNTIVYVSPNMNGFTLAAAAVNTGSATTTVAAATGTSANDLAEGVSVAAMYSNGPFFASVGYEDLSDNMMGAVGTNNGQEKVSLGLGYTANNFHVGFVYEDQDINGANNDNERMMLNGSYTFGNNVVKAQWMELDAQAANGDVDKWAIGLDHNMSKRTKVYAVYADSDTQNGNDWSGFSAGMVTKF